MLCTGMEIEGAPYDVRMYIWVGIACSEHSFFKSWSRRTLLFFRLETRQGRGPTSSFDQVYGCQTHHWKHHSATLFFTHFWLLFSSYSNTEIEWRKRLRYCWLASLEPSLVLGSNSFDRGFGILMRRLCSLRGTWSTLAAGQKKPHLSWIQSQIESFARLRLRILKK